MAEVQNLFSDLALILATACIVTVLFKWLKQPLVLGYITAGFLIGPYFSYFPFIVDTNSVKTWSDIGMVFLLFALGLEFSFKKLKKVGSVGAITVIIELIIMSISGSCIGHLLGWSKMNCIFLGCMLSISSTTIIIKAFDDLKLKQEKYTNNVIGILVVEDLLAVLLMVILSTLSVSKQFDGKELLFNMLKLAFFLVTWFVFGIYLIPTVLKLVRKLMTEETLVIFSLGLCFIMVVFANYAGFSPALGAFVMGSILAETIEAETIQRLIAPIKNLFGAVFFVSVGMMINPSVIIEYALPILIIALTVMIMKSLSATLGVFITSHNLKTSIQSGFCFCQIGEFSFIIASFGLSFKVIEPFLYPVIVSVSVITTFFTPYIMRLATPVYNKLEPLVKPINNISSNNNTKTVNDNNQALRMFLTRQMKRLVIYSVIIIAIIFLVFIFITPFINKYTVAPWSGIINTSVTLILLSPFIWAMAFKSKFSVQENLNSVNSNLNKIIVLTVTSLRYLLSLCVVYFIIDKYNDASFIITLGISFAYSALLAISSHIMMFYDKIEKHFIENLNNRQSQESFIIPEILQENFHFERMLVSPNSQLVGKQLKDTMFRSKYNVNIISIQRGDKFYDLPDNKMVFYPYDKISMIGSDDNINKLRPFIEVEKKQLINERQNKEMELHNVVVSMNHTLCHKHLKESGFKEKYNAMVIAIEHNGEFILNPKADTIFEDNDKIWFVCTENAYHNIINAISK